MAFVGKNFDLALNEALKALKILKIEQALKNTQVEIAQLRIKRINLLINNDYDLKDVVMLNKQIKSLQETLLSLSEIQKEFGLYQPN